MAKKKIRNFELDKKKLLIDKRDKYSIRSQCKLLGINVSSVYYKPNINIRDIEMMHLLDEQYMKTPFYGVRKMTKILHNKGYDVGKYHIRTLLRKMGLEAIFPKRNISKSNLEHKIYPYLLNGLIINKPNQIWSSDITYIRLSKGFAYLVAVIDWYSRYVLSWEISNSLDNYFCIEALNEALERYGNPEIFNTDQGSQFTSNKYIDILIKEGISISMDGRGRAFDNIFIERLWRSVKYENIYLYDYQNIFDVKYGLKNYFEFYNKERIHQSINYKTPWQIYSNNLVELKEEERLNLANVY